MYGRGKKLSKPKKQNNKSLLYQKRANRKLKIEDVEIVGHFLQEKKKKRKKGIREKAKHNERLIKDRIIRDIRALFEQKEEDYCKPERTNNVWNNNYIEYESNGNKNRNVSLDKYLNKIKPYLRDIIIDLQNSDTWKIQLKIAINFISSKDA